MNNIEATLLSEDGEASFAAAADGEDLWIAASDVEKAIGWKLTRDGFCRGSVCIPIPRGSEAELSRADGAVNLTGFARLRGQALVHNDDKTVWALDASTGARTAVRASLEAPDFTLPDLGGRMYSLHQHRGKKVLIASWASW